MSFKPSSFQIAIADTLENDTCNMVINAVAGSGKTTTLIHCMEFIPSDVVTYYLAFNKAIVEDIKPRVPAHINVMTLHSMGAKALYSYRRSQLDDKKSYNVVSKLRDEWHQDSPGMIDADYLVRVRRLVDLFRQNLCVKAGQLTAIAKKHGIQILDGEVEKAMQVLHTMLLDEGTHDFTDMLYLPAVNPEIKLPLADYILVDESQDLNRAQQMLIRKMMHDKTRFIAVGDPYQAIYGFAGADADSFENMKLFPYTKELPLSINYRCAKSIIRFVNEQMPGIPIMAREDAPEGEVNHSASFKDIRDGDMVLCRNTAPLVKMCLQFIKNKHKAYVKGGDMGKQLANMVTRSGAKTIDLFEDWLEKELGIIYKRIAKKYPKMTHGEIVEEPAFVVMEEKKEVFLTIIDNADIGTPGELIQWIYDLFTDNKAGICFSTIHKSKGLENERVFIIERNLMPSQYAKKDWQLVQEINLMYVAYTRGKEYLGFVADWQYKNK